ncbi:transcription-repair coupling factor (superfamily II helicase) [Anaerobranca californiensis DSM 14826]|uniref:Transcription-repair-coupling factor n=1 Tax=Anaerobranca californiensis DSM 14826 TaxID=1120989 RepID=A0A1M6PIN8_9FIRM|nr:transcription-repair coupling factor [Anaerobranca californiensis]SHK07806.1 transcription-repair coupling factor (superfamily II helicase) [Anaerobranca californiensis DSM 14826]
MNYTELKSIPEFKEIEKNIKKKKRTLVYGLSGAQKSFLIANLIQSTDLKILFINNNHSSSERVMDELKTYLGEDKVGLFPSNPLLPGEVDYRSKDIELQRIETLKGIIEGNLAVVVTQIQNLLEILPSKEVLLEASFTIKCDEDYVFSDIAEKLTELGYIRSTIVEKKGDFSIRGSIVDIYSSVLSNPVRIEFFGDTVESIRYFDIASQRSKENIDEITIYPNTLNILNRERKNKLINVLNTLLLNSKDGKVKEKITRDLERIENNLIFENLGQYSSVIYDGGVSLLDLLEDYLIVLDEPPFIKTELEGWEKDYREGLKHLIEKGEVTNIPLYLESDKIIHKLKGKNLLYLCLLLRTLGPFPVDDTVSLPFRQAPVFAGNIELFLKEVEKLVQESYQVKIYYNNKETKENLIKEFTHRGIILGQGGNPGVYFNQGPLEEGFIFDKGKIACFVESQIYKRTRGKKGKGLQQGVNITDISHLDIGDYVVHINHGIGIFKGIITLEVAGGKRDYIHVQYAGNDKLYIPTDQLHLLQKYVGGEGKEPKIYSLSGNEWIKTTEKAKKSIKNMAENLLYLYAKRQNTQGFQFSPDNHWQSQFEGTFPYTETEDQLTAIKEIKRDMEQPKPMDRLLCGDVGYGKTEVAMRAAMKAVLDGKQVAVLVPTTILAQQHYKTFKERFIDFPVNIDVFSRFRTKKEIEEGLARLAAGVTDIAIGTHKLLQKNVVFKDLGLIIIDEEQRFGVAHKEKLKELKVGVDVLTLTATPIPRTLHMSMLGIRDLSVIETPPEDRFPVQTYVLEYSDDIITTAIRREIERGGQVYFLYNRVQKIEMMAARLQSLLPDARIAIAHGQMSENKLEKTMLEFLEGEHDILLSTTIIETGLDIPNVNTLIIYDADKFGLSQLYQLRGRVGRSNRIAYCYLTYQKDKVLTEVAQKRLQAIKEFTELGSGFKIAMRDLEIRGAGNILGVEQHGFIASIGFDLYCQLLEEAIAELKGEKKEEPLLDITLELPVDGFIPEKMMSKSLKMAFYRKISTANNLERLHEIEEELIDRFGELPIETTNLIDIARIKLMGQKLQVKSITAKSLGYLQKIGTKEYSVEIKFYPNTKITGKDLLEIYQNNLKLNFTAKGHNLIIELKKVEKSELLGEIEKLFHQIFAVVN